MGRGDGAAVDLAIGSLSPGTVPSPTMSEPGDQVARCRLGARGMLIHIGVPKTGTTALQSCLAASREVLAAAGIAYPGTRHNHVPAVRYPLGWPASPEQIPHDERRWNALVRDAARHDGPIVVSAESLAVADQDRAAAILGRFDRDPVEVVVTLRSLDRVLPSAWQEDVKAGLRTPFVEWADDIARGPSVADPATLWVTQDHAAVVRRWAEVVGADNVTVVVIDSARPDAMFATFASLLGLPAGALVPERADRRNRSLTAPEAEMLVRLNELMETPGAYVTRRRPIPPRALWHLLDHRVPDAAEPRIAVPGDLVDRLIPIARESVSQIESMGVRVIGDLERLVPERRQSLVGSAIPDPAPAVSIDAVSIEAAALLIEGMLRYEREAIPSVSARDRAAIAAQLDDVTELRSNDDGSGNQPVKNASMTSRLRSGVIAPLSESLRQSVSRSRRVLRSASNASRSGRPRST